MSPTSYQLLHLASMFCHKIRGGVFVKNFLRQPFSCALKPPGLSCLKKYHCKKGIHMSSPSNPLLWDKNEHRLKAIPFPEFKTEHFLPAIEAALEEAISRSSSASF